MKKRPSNVPKSKDNRANILLRDIMGRTTLHIAILCNEPEALRSLLAYPELKDLLMAVDFENGWNILHYIYFYKRIRCYNVLMEHLDSRPSSHTIFMDLLKAKDRCRHAPLTLLNNDIKDLAWVPAYLNEKNEYHLIPRFDLKESQKLSDSSFRSQSPFRSISNDWWSDKRGGSDICVFGVNVNNNLGVGDSTDRSTPSHVSHHDFKDEVDLSFGLKDILRRPRFNGIRISKYHSVIVTLNGRLYTCGVGSRGRLGHGNSSNVFRFKRVKFFDDQEKIVQVAIANNHNLVLCSDNSLFSWGHNNLNQLGFTSTVSNSFKKTVTDVYENSPKQVISGDLRKCQSLIIGVCASKIHSLAYTENAVYFWGLNIGQMGLTQTESTADHTVNGKIYKGCIVAQSKEVKFRDKIKLVSTCETCTCVVTEMNDIHIYFGGQRVKLPKLPTRIDTDSQFDSFKPSKLSSPAVVTKIAMKSHEHIHVLLESGNVMSFLLNSSDLKALKSTKYAFLWLAHDVDMYAVDIDNSYDGSIIVATRNGSVFSKSNQMSVLQRRNSIGASTLPTFHSSTKNKFRKVEHVNKALRVTCDDSFSSFAVLRDDVDPLPFKLQTNDFLPDMAFLSPLSEPDAFRKQNQLLNSDHHENCYVTSYMYPRSKESSDGTRSILQSIFKRKASGESDKLKDKAKDNLRETSNLKFSTKLIPPESEKMYQPIPDPAPLISSLCSSAIYDFFLLDSDWPRRKFCDAYIMFVNKPELKIGFHTQILKVRSALFRKVLDNVDEGVYFVHEGLKGRFNSSTMILTLETDVDERSVLIWLHYVYTNNVLELWSMDVVRSLTGIDIKKIKADFDLLIALFQMDIFHCKLPQYFAQVQTLVHHHNPNTGIRLVLSECEKRASPSILVSRTAFFETILSGRWQAGEIEYSPDGMDSRSVNLANVGPVHLDVILKHIYGCNDLDIFETAREFVSDSKDPEDFVLFLLEMIELSDEFLLIQLKHLCELAVSEFLTCNNVLLILAHADYGNAQKLIMSCCWYIYNNLEILFFDSVWRDLNFSLLEQVEDIMLLLSNCKHIDFVLATDHLFEVKALMKVSGRGGALQFIDDSLSFNDIYMSDRRGFMAFDILVDLKPDMQPPKPKKLTARRPSRKTSFENPFKNFTISLNSNNLAENESAIADDDDFEMVTNRKKRDKSRASSVAERYSPSPNEIKDEVDSQSVESPVESSQLASAPILQHSPFYASGEGSSQNASSSSIATVSPALGESIEQEKKPSKIKFSTLKLSQKQRKKIADEKLKQNKSSESTTLASTNEVGQCPWKLTPSPSTKVAVSSKLSNMPILGLAPKQVKAKPLEELSWNDRQRLMPVKKTLQEVQQEEEFAKWWEEESKRVQMEISGTSGAWQGYGQANGRGNGVGSSSRGGRGGRGKKGSRSSRAP